MLKGNFSTDNADNNVLCPYGFFNTNQSTNDSSSGTAYGGWCQNITTSNGNTFATILPDGSNPTIATSSRPNYRSKRSDRLSPADTSRRSTSTPTASRFRSCGRLLPQPPPRRFLPTAVTTTYQPIINHDNGWIYRGRLDYNWNENNKFYIAYQQGYDKQLANGAGTNIFTPPEHCSFPGGGLYKTTYSKMISGHFVHIFNATTTNEAIASWVYGSIPTAPLNPSADFRTTIGFNVPTVYGGASTYAPTYGSSVTYGYAFPASPRPTSSSPVTSTRCSKTIPTYQDNFTKVFGKHTFKAGAFASNTDNFQGNMGTNLQGNLTYSTGAGESNYFASIGTCGATCGSYIGNVSEPTTPPPHSMSAS